MELKNDLAITGTLHSVDQYLNIKLNNIRVSAAVCWLRCQPDAQCAPCTNRCLSITAGHSRGGTGARVNVLLPAMSMNFRSNRVAAT